MKGKKLLSLRDCPQTCKPRTICSSTMTWRSFHPPLCTAVGGIHARWVPIDLYKHAALEIAATGSTQSQTHSRI